MLDLSTEMVELRSELQRVLMTSSHQSQDPSTSAGGDSAAMWRGTEALCQSDVERIIVDCVTARRYSRALQCVRYYG